VGAQKIFLLGADYPSYATAYEMPSHVVRLLMCLLTACFLCSSLF